MKKLPENPKNDQLKMDFPLKTSNNANYNSGKVININDRSIKAFASFIVKNSKSF
ncbi:hypothetical protein [Mucilaginibacter sp.]|uniref:hypothetical protein n=1 Tax=Mucilaginibacter sp. TaxID=1882438 RepID=UPI00262E76A6|nr:hypothetical protein [Mucilaginibacter sp.]MDB4921512.1 hypothetical protein [Mucilaginibacter sp.]